MIPSNPNPIMNSMEVEHFHAEMTRRMRGNLTPLERQRISNAKRTYAAIIRNNDGKNPLFCH